LTREREILISSWQVGSFYLLLSLHFGESKDGRDLFGLQCLLLPRPRAKKWSTTEISALHSLAYWDFVCQEKMNMPKMEALQRVVFPREKRWRKLD
jgi:hypothetical protein